MPTYRELRPEFLELVLSHEPWASVPRHPKVGIRCALVRGDIYLDDHEIAPTLWFHKGKIDRKVSLMGTKLKRSLILRGSTVTGKLKANGMEVGGGLFLRDGTFADIDLLSARIAGDAAFDGSTVTGQLDGSGMEVGGDLFLRGGGTFADIDLIGAKIGGSIQLAGSTFGGELNLTGTAIGGELHLSSGWQESFPTWQNGASLILRNAKAEALQARGGSWSIFGGDGLLSTDLTGFTFNRLGGLDTSGGTGMGDESADWLIGWIEAQRGHGENYDPQPYIQLAQVLEAAGATDTAKAVR